MFDNRTWIQKDWANQSDAEKIDGVDKIRVLVAAWKPLLVMAHVDVDLIEAEFISMKQFIYNQPGLRMTKFQPLWEYMFNFKGDESRSKLAVDPSFFNVLVLVLFSWTLAVDTSICERAFSLMNRLMNARRSRMSSNVLRMLMRICSRGHAWRDAAEIPVLEILAKWKASANHYASDQMFKKVALEEVSHIHWLPFNILVRTNR